MSILTRLREHQKQMKHNHKQMFEWLTSLQDRDLDDLYRVLKSAPRSQESYAANLLLEKFEAHITAENHAQAPNTRHYGE